MGEDNGVTKTFPFLGNQVIYHSNTSHDRFSMPTKPQSYISLLPGQWNPLKWLLVTPFIFLLFSGLAIPSDGNHGFMSIKGLSFLFSMLSVFIYIYITNRTSLSQLSLIVSLLFILCFLLFWGLFFPLTDSRTVHTTLDQFKLFWLTVCVFGIIVFMIDEGLVTYPFFLRWVINLNFAYSFFKVILTALFLLRFIQLEVFLKFLGIRYTSMAIYGDLSRLQTSMDVLTPFLILYVLLSSRLGVNFSQLFKNTYIFFSLISILLSFSRFLFFVAGCSFLFYWLTLSGKEIFKRFIFSLMLTCTLVTWIGWDKVYKVVELRFFSKDNTEVSDSVRIQQVNALIDEFNKSPILGVGLGGFSNKYVRDIDNPHSYEVQWVAFLTQFGMAGMLMIFFTLILICVPYFTRPFSRLHMAFLSLYLVWIFSGFTNPYLISLASGIFYGLLYTTGKQLASLSSFNQQKLAIS